MHPYLIIILTLLSIVFIFVALIVAVAIKISSFNSQQTHSNYNPISISKPINITLDKGNYGEFLTYQKLENSHGEKKILSNLYIPKFDGTTTEVDLLLINQTGIYVIESKNYSGWIFGNDRDTRWTQTLSHGQKNHFYNPIFQNRTHIAALQRIVPEVDQNRFYSYIIFSERCELKKVTIANCGDRLIKRNHLEQTLYMDINARPQILSTDEINAINERLMPYTQADRAIREQHIQNIQKMNQ